MHALVALSRLIDRITAGIGRIVMWLIFASVLVSAGNAIIRKIQPQMASNAWLELQWYLFGVAFMLAAANTLQQNEHISIDIFYGSRSRRTRHWIDLFGHIFFLMPFVILMSWMLIPYTWDAYRIGQISTNAGGLIIWPARAALAAGFILLIFQGLSEIIKKIAIMRGLIEDPHPFLSPKEQAEEEARAVMAALGTEVPGISATPAGKGDLA
jgi:TRAP-type mannitol/chloroaromatic compound transport system permease small subunit